METKGKPTITRISPPEGDWEAIYCGNKLIGQGHTVPLWEIVEGLGFAYESREVETDTDYPDTLGEVLEVEKRSKEIPAAEVP